MVLHEVFALGFQRPLTPKSVSKIDRAFACVLFNIRHHGLGRNILFNIKGQAVLTYYLAAADKIFNNGNLTTQLEQAFLLKKNTTFYVPVNGINDL